MDHGDQKRKNAEIAALASKREQVVDILVEALWRMMRDGDNQSDTDRLFIKRKESSQPMEIVEKISEEPCFSESTEPSCPGGGTDRRTTKAGGS